MRSFSMVVMSVLVAVFLTTGCGNAGSVAGTWVCKEHYMDNMVDKLSLELKEDGTVIMSPFNSEGTYQEKGNKVVVNVELFGSETEIELKKDGGKLVASSDAGDIVYEKK